MVEEEKSAEELENRKPEFVPHSNFHKIVIVQVICAAILLLGIIAVRYINKESFSDIRSFYEKNLLTETSVDEVLGEDGQNEA